MARRISVVALIVLVASCGDSSEDGENGAATDASDDTASPTVTYAEDTGEPPTDTSNGGPADSGSDTAEDTSSMDDTSDETGEPNDTSCTPDCSGKECGPNGCGGTCGSCGSGQTCDSNQQCVCQPDCSNKQCGDDGCGGSCGTCGSGKTCKNNQCKAPSFKNDVMGLVNKYGCASMFCHDSKAPQRGLDLSDAQTAYNHLVGVDADECSGRKRVEPGAPSNSYLIHKLEGQNLCFGARMPQDGPPYLTSSEIDTIRTWIANGAPNN